MLVALCKPLPSRGFGCDLKPDVRLSKSFEYGRACQPILIWDKLIYFFVVGKPQELLLKLSYRSGFIFFAIVLGLLIAEALHRSGPDAYLLGEHRDRLPVATAWYHNGSLVWLGELLARSTNRDFESRPVWIELQFKSYSNSGLIN